MTALAEIGSACEAHPNEGVLAVESPFDRELQRQALRLWNTRLNHIEGLDYSTLAAVPAADESPLVAATILSQIEERRLFERMHVAAYRTTRLLTRWRGGEHDPDLLAAAERQWREAYRLRNGLWVVFQKLVVSIARPLISSRWTLDDLVAEGNTALWQAISHFNPAFGFRFSTYATHAIRRRLLRAIRRATRETQVDPRNSILTSVPDDRRWTIAYQQRVERELAGVERLLVELTPRERYVIRSRFGLGREFEPRTLREIAAELELSHERVRQLEQGALRKLRSRLAATEA